MIKATGITVYYNNRQTSKKEYITVIQAKKADLTVWGDPSVLALEKIPAQYRQTMQMTAPGALSEKVPTLAEPHSSWVAAIEAEWLKRYGAK